MRVISKEEFVSEKDRISERIISGAVFIYPTDTIYGIGCDAGNSKAVKKIRQIKNRFEKPFSVIAPSKEWIRKNCKAGKNTEDWIKKLPGPYTLVMNLSNLDAIDKGVNMGMDTIGVRMPDHWFSEFVVSLGIPVVTTSANKAGENFMTSIEDLDPEIRAKVDFIIYEGENQGSPSKIVMLNSENDEVITR